MRRLSLLLLTGVVGVGFVAVGAISACSGAPPESAFPPRGSDGGGGGAGDGSGSGGGSSGGGGGGDGGGFMPGSDSAAPSSDSGLACPSGLQCNVSCNGGGTTTLKGKVYDPAGKNPLYNVAVYVPATPLVALPKGVPTGADACNCGALFQSGALANATTAVDGSFTLSNVPVGNNVPLVIQVGKWRALFHTTVQQCTENVQADHSLKFPSSVAPGDTDDNIPDIAVSTGGADTLECLMERIGLKPSEYVAGTASTGHVHVFSGGMPGATVGMEIPAPETNVMPGAPVSSTDLWASQAQLMPYDIVLLSCEGGETYNANPSALESYLNVGGRAFASHFQYSWFAGQIDGAPGAGPSYAPPSDWGTNLASWAADQKDGPGPTGGIIDMTLNGSSTPFAKGVALQQWLTGVGALGQNGVPPGELSIYQPRFNASVAPTTKPSQPWITSDPTGQAGATMYFSFDTPVNAPAADGGAPAYCGRAVFSDLHVAGDPTTSDQGNALVGGSPPPGGCSNTNLSPQEKALEFMLFDLSSCVIPDTVAPPQDAGLPRVN